MGEPVVFPRESLVNTVVEVFVVGEDDMAANIVKLQKYEYFDFVTGSFNLQSLLWSHL